MKLTGCRQRRWLARGVEKGADAGAVGREERVHQPVVEDNVEPSNRFWILQV